MNETCVAVTHSRRVVVVVVQKIPKTAKPEFPVLWGLQIQEVQIFNVSLKHSIDSKYLNH